jgi:mannose-6-phosphate isomerase class I
MYDRFPFVSAGEEAECLTGWEAILGALSMARIGPLVVECYPGVLLDEIEEAMQRRLAGWTVLRTDKAFLAPAEIERRFASVLTDDPVFGLMDRAEIGEFCDPGRLAALQRQTGPRTVILGPGARLVCPEGGLLIHADMARWELQRRQRSNLIPNLGLENREERAALKYKRAFFLDWRVADRVKQGLLASIDFLLDTNTPGSPRMITGDAFRRGLRRAVSRPFRLVPFFDPGPWGGHWMERVCGLPEDGAPNHAWCFDCVPEENSLLLGFGPHRVEIPAIDLVFAHPQELLGEAVTKRFGAEFPIRFDLLDTMGGGNLSLQVHPAKEYIQRRFGMTYTQDESYYLLDAGSGAGVYLGLKEGIDRAAMVTDLGRAQGGGFDFPVDTYVHRIPARKHDHFLIPAGTIHCSGKDSMVLEISATPYLFTFKLWDWGRLGLDGRPRPLHMEHGIENIQWDRTTGWVERELVNRFEEAQSGDGWREERTGLHPLEFIETRRHWFTKAVPHETRGTVHVLNLVEGDAAIVESPTGAFEPMEVHYAETFVVPAAVGAYSVRPTGTNGREHATMLAYVRA